jgi:hypothetical protein
MCAEFVSQFFPQCHKLRSQPQIKNNMEDCPNCQEKGAPLPQEELPPLEESPSKEVLKSEVIPVTLTISVTIPSGPWTEKQKHDLAMYIALFTTKYSKGFQKFDWGMGAFMCEPIKIGQDSEVRVDVTALDEKMRFSTDSYDRQKFIDTFGEKTLESLPQGWPVSAVQAEPSGSFETEVVSFGKLALDEPKIVEIN